MRYLSVKPSSVARPEAPYFKAVDSGGNVVGWGPTHEVAAERAYALVGKLPTFFYCEYK